MSETTSQTIDISFAKAPRTHAEASVFLRKYCKAQLNMKEDHDELRIVLRGTDVNEEYGIKFEIRRELETSDHDEWAICFTEAAEKAWQAWKGINKGK